MRTRPSFRSRSRSRRGAAPRPLFVLLAVAGLAAPSLAPAPAHAQTRPIGPEAFETWNTLGTRAISDDGQWAYFTLTKEDGDDELVVRSTSTDTEYRIERGASPTFALNGRRVVYRIVPAVEASREARSNRNGETPRDSLGVLNLETGERTTEPLLRSFQVSADDARFLAVHLRPEADEAPGESALDGDKEHGTLMVRDLETGSSSTYWYASAFSWAPEGGALLAVLSAPAAAIEAAGELAPPGLHWIDAASGEVTPVLESRGDFRQLTFNADASRIAFLHQTGGEAEGAVEDEPTEPGEPEAGDGDGDGSDDNDDTWALHHWSPGLETPATVTSSAGEGLRDGWELSEFGSVSFSEDGTRLFFGTAPAPDPTPQDRPRLDTEVDVEVWHWEDGDLMTVQKLRANQERRRSFTAVHFLGSDPAGAMAGEAIVQLADPDLPGVSVGQDGNGRWAVGTTTNPYAIEASWESPNFRDSWLVEVETGERTQIAQRTQGSPSLSPEERWLTWWEPGDSTWVVQEVSTGERQPLDAGIPHPVWNEQNDSPSAPGSYGGAGWMDGESAILLYDRYDVWAVDPADPASARSLSGEAGRRDGIRYRLVRLDSDREEWSSDQVAFATAFDVETRDAGFARLALGGGADPERILMEPRSFSTPVQAADANVLLFTQETFRDFPDLWVAEPDFTERTRISHANPQQDEYRWGDTELVSWTSLDGLELDGILITPDDFDPDREYPLIVYFYERNSDNLHSHYAPVPHRSIINFPMYTSHDYLVFIPDIVYREGYPGESAFNAIMPGVTSLLDRDFVDRDRIAMQGHSWAGYQIAFMVTRSQNFFRAAAAGAPVANMTSAYGGIRWASGLVRQFQYERTQSRLGQTLWEAPMRYLENSPLFWVDKIETPLLIMHNDEDGAVPFEQGIELFVALRRLSKPAWLINYTGEPHWPTSFANKRDWNLRMMQFFDHFLKDEPAPRWMVEGIPYIERNRTLGFEPVPGSSVVDPSPDGEPHVGWHRP